MKTLLLVFLGGGIGSLLRYLTSIITQKFYNGTFPVATLTVNIIGCLLIGILVGFFEKIHVNPNLKFLFITGFCGGFTTFSAFSMESISLIQNQQTALALTYILLSVFLGLIAVWAGLFLAK